ncbi:MAG TPA: radical SAM protein [Thermoanaerobaculia bacterium]|nr:radical SAM protein [Thermoanaerobaculia bacterium]
MSGEPIGRPAHQADGLRRLETPGLDADAAWMRAAVEAFEPRMRELAGRGAAPAAWEEIPGGGCGWTCRCCPPAAARRRLDLDRWSGRLGDRHRSIGRGDHPLAARLSRSRSRGETVVLGAAADPWGGDAGRRARTRALLASLVDHEGLEIAVLTASPLVVCDLDLLVALDAAHSLTVEISLATVEPSIARLLSAAAHPPAEVLAAGGELAAQGLAVRWRLRPLMPGINDGEDGIAALLVAADAVGAVDVSASPLVLPWGGTRRRYFAWLADARPDLLGDYRRLYRARTRLPVSERSAMLESFERLHLAHGFPRPRPGRG